jgi:hypothetical protein
MKRLITLLIAAANGIVWAFILACYCRPQVWMAFGPTVATIVALKVTAP